MIITNNFFLWGKKTGLPIFFTILLILFPLYTQSLENSTNTNSNTNIGGKNSIQESVLSDNWYTHDKDKLNQELEEYIALAEQNFNVATDPRSIRAIIAPHAGSFYSWLCAATAFQTLLQKTTGKTFDEQKNTKITRVIVLAPSHRVYFTHIAIPHFTLYRTALGDIPVDREAIKKLEQKNNVFKIFKEAYLQEHALEIQLPLLQKTVANFKLVPLIVGHINSNNILTIITALKEIIDDSTLLVISSDFVHHGPNFDYQLSREHILDTVRHVDSLAVEAISSGSGQAFEKVIQQTKATICGRDAIRILFGLLEIQTYPQLEPKLTCYYTSPQLQKARSENREKINIKKLFDDIPDTDAENSVSYVGMVFSTQKNSSLPLADRLTDYEKKVLLKLARDSIAYEFLPKEKKKDEKLLLPIASKGLTVNAGAFVTLNKKQNHELRGCIGRIITKDPLLLTVKQMSKAAAFHDSRFSPLTKNELEEVVIDISVLEPPVSVPSWKDIVIGKHGVILTKEYTSAVFLPQVAVKQSWDIKTMLQHLSRKAGLEKDAWQKGTSFKVFEGFEIKESE